MVVCPPQRGRQEHEPDEPRNALNFSLTVTIIYIASVRTNRDPNL